MKRPTVGQWVAYSVSIAVAAPLVVHFGNKLLSSRHGAFARDAICAVTRVLPNGDLARLFSTVCRAAKDGKITTEEARSALDRGAKAAKISSSFFDNDSYNTDIRAQDEVDYALERWKFQNPAPVVSHSLRKQFPSMLEAQLCVLSQAEKYHEDGSIGLRYVGMGVCEEE